MTWLVCCHYCDDIGFKTFIILMTWNFYFLVWFYKCDQQSCKLLSKVSLIGRANARKPLVRLYCMKCHCYCDCVVVLGRNVHTHSDVKRVT